MTQPARAHFRDLSLSLSVCLSVCLSPFLAFVSTSFCASHGRAWFWWQRCGRTAWRRHGCCRRLQLRHALLSCLISLLLIQTTPQPRVLTLAWLCLIWHHGPCSLLPSLPSQTHRLFTSEKSFRWRSRRTFPNTFRSTSHSLVGVNVYVHACVRVCTCVCVCMYVHACVWWVGDRLKQSAPSFCVAYPLN